MNFAASNGSMGGSTSQAGSPAWLKQSVQQFLLGVNWENQPAEIQSLRLAAAQPHQTLSLMLPVYQFLAACNWDGTSRQPVATSPLPDADSEDDAFTLDNFSGLF